MKTCAKAYWSIKHQRAAVMWHGVVDTDYGNMTAAESEAKRLNLLCADKGCDKKIANYGYDAEARLEEREKRIEQWTGLAAANHFFTVNDAANGYVKTKEKLKTCTTDELVGDYRRSLGDCFRHNMFYQNAIQWLNLVVEELHSRGVTCYLDCFGEVSIKKREG